MIIYSLRQNVSGIKSAAIVGVLAIMLYLSLIVIDLLIRCNNDGMPYDFDINFTEIKVSITDYDFFDFFSCIACIILSFSFHPYTFSIYEYKFNNFLAV